MKEPLSLLVSEGGGTITPAAVAAAMTAGDSAAAVAGMWELMSRMIQGEENLPISTLAAWVEALPTPFAADTRVGIIRSWVLYEQRRNTSALLVLEQLVEEWQARLDGPEADTARWWLAQIRMGQGVIYEIEGRWERAQEAFEAVRRSVPAAAARGGTPTLELDQQEAERLAALDPTGLTRVAVRALAFFQAFGARAGLARAAHNIGHQYLDSGEPAAARYWLEQALDLKRGQPGEFPVLYTLDTLGRCYQQLGLLEEAQTLLDEALRIAARLGATAIQASSLSYLGDVYRDRDELGTALDLYRKALAMREKLKDPGGMAETHLSLSTLHRRAGHAGLAADAAAEARTIGHGHSSAAFRVRASLHEAVAGILLGDAGAVTELTRVVAELSHLHSPGDEALGRWYLAVAARRAGDGAEAGAQLAAALAAGGRFRHMHRLAMELPVTAEVCTVLGGPGAGPEALAGLVQRASARGLLALLRAVPGAHDLVAAAGRLPEATSVSVQVLGAFRVARAGCEIDMGAARSQKAVSLFKFLVAQRGRLVAREQILDAIWPEADPESADRSFEVTLSTLRRLLDPPQGLTLIIRRGRGYMLNPDVPVLLDVEQFRTHLERGNWWQKRGQTLLAVAEWEAAEAAYGGDFLADDPYEDWATADRERLREQHLDLLLKLGTVALEEGRPDEAVERAHRVLMCDPIREAAFRLLMRAHVRQGNRAVALRDLQRCSEVLRRELGEEPTAETTELARRIRAGLWE